jgi:uncharacterized membrane protein
MMDPAHLHLLINHLPVFGSLMGALVLAHALYTKNNQTKMAAYYVIIISSIGAVIAYLTGEPAEHLVEDMAGISHDAIEEHEDAAIYALYSFIALGILSLIGLYLALKKHASTRMMAMIVLVVSLLSFAIIARTGYLGGQIRHTEIYSPQPAQGPEMENEDHD